MCSVVSSRLERMKLCGISDSGGELHYSVYHETILVATEQERRVWEKTNHRTENVFIGFRKAVMVEMFSLMCRQFDTLSPAIR